MKRLSTTVVAGLLLVGLVAAPAAADRSIESGQLPHFTFASFFGAEFEGQSEVVQVPTGEWVFMANGWGTVTEAQRDDFLATVIVEVELDGVSQPFDTVLFENDEPGALFPYIVGFEVLLNPGRVSVPEQWTLRWTFTEDHFDGLDWFPAGTVFEGRRTIVWTQRGLFPSADYPCPNGEYPCTDF